MNHMAIALHLQHRLNEALALYQEALAQKKMMFGPLHPSVAMTEYCMADAYIEKGQTDKALPLLEHAHGCFLKYYGAQHQDTVKVAALIEELKRREIQQTGSCPVV